MLVLDKEAKALAPGVVAMLMHTEKQFYRNLATVLHKELPPDLIEQRMVEWTKFFVLKRLTGDENATLLSPSRDIDQVWHTVLLFPKEYAGLCEKISVLRKQDFPWTLIDHNPLLGVTDKPEENFRRRERYERTLQVYEQVFGGKPPVEVWEPIEPDVENHENDNTTTSPLSNVHVLPSEQQQPQEQRASNKRKQENEGTQPTSKETFPISVINHGSVLMTLQVKKTMLIREVKNMIAKYRSNGCGYPFEDQVLHSGGVELRDDKEVGEYHWWSGKHNACTVLLTSAYDLRVEQQNKQFEEEYRQYQRQTVGGVQIFVKTLTGKTITINVSFELSLGAFKAAIQKLEGIPIEQQRLAYKGDVLGDDTQTLAHYNIKMEATLYLALKLRGC